MTSAEVSKIVTKSSIRNHGKYWPITKWVFILVLFFLVIYLGTLPVRGSLAKKYLSQGDAFLTQEKYLSADLAYRKAQVLTPKDANAVTKRELAGKASRNILELKDLVRSQNLEAKTSLFELATSVPKSETDAVRTSRQLIEKGEYQLAIIPAKTATEMDKTYRDAWVYLGIANLRAATLLETNNEVQLQYRNAAKDAFNQAYSLDPTYEVTSNYLKSINQS